jgi:mono/diheme cytochrome c family protein
MTLRNFLLLLILSLASACVNVVDNSGEASYNKHCAGCHGADGEGLGNYIPPLKDADFLIENENQLACIIKYGIDETILVNGTEYTQPMGGLSQLDNAEVTNLINFIRKKWMNKEAALTIQEVSDQIAACE